MSSYKTFIRTNLSNFFNSKVIYSKALHYNLQIWFCFYVHLHGVLHKFANSALVKSEMKISCTFSGSTVNNTHTVTPAVNGAIFGERKCVSVAALWRWQFLDFLNHFKPFGFGLIVGVSKPQTAVAAFATRTNFSVSVYHKRAVLPCFNLSQESWRLNICK